MSTKAVDVVLAEARPGMILAENLTDMHGQVLLPKGCCLTESNLATLRRRDIAAVRILHAGSEPDGDEHANVAAKERLARLFRKLGDGPGDQFLKSVVSNHWLGSGDGRAQS